VGEGDGERAPLLLHSLAALREIVLPALDAAAARHVVEVGGEVGGFTAHLVARAQGNGGRVDVVDPAPAAELTDLARTSDVLHLVRRPSPGALAEIGHADAYLLDGDHNYATVLGELEAIRSSSGEGVFPLVVVHDVGWPCARRDQYYRPEALPTGAVHAHTYDAGVHPDSPGVVHGGFSGAGEFAYALEEGGPRNGVLTAVEDFLADQPNLVFVRVPCIFGLGVLSDAASPYADELARRLAWCDENPLLARLEENRLALYLKVHDVLRDLDAVAAERDEARAALEELRAAVRALADSRTIRAIDAMQRPTRVLRPDRPGVRALLHQVADDQL
jgi:Methyltransferase domain